MSKLILTMIMAVLTLVPPVVAQKKVSRKDKQYQLASMEFEQYKFRPKEYYYSWYSGFLGIKIPGLGIHDKGPAGTMPFLGDNYVNEDWRKMTPLRAAALAESSKEELDRETVSKQWDDVMKADVIELADGLLDITGSESSIRSAYLKCKDSLASLAAYLTPEQASCAEDELQLVKETIDDFSGSGMGAARKEKGYTSLRRKIEELEERYHLLAADNLLDKIIYSK